MQPFSMLLRLIRASPSEHRKVFVLICWSKSWLHLYKGHFQKMITVSRLLSKTLQRKTKLSRQVTGY
jgi:hypothetical protein